MGTLRQKRLARVIVEDLKSDKHLNAGQMLEKVGYSRKMARAKSKDVIEIEGVKAELKELGFDEFSAKKVVQEIMLDKEVDPSARLKATDQVFKVVGSYAPEKQDVNVNGSIIYLPAKKKK